MSQTHPLRSRPAQRGFTLIELMIAMLIASLLVGLAFSIFTRMSVAYRGQSEVSEIQQSLQAAHMEMVRHLRAAGHLVPDGFRLVNSTVQQPLVRDNDSLDADDYFDADMVMAFYASTSAMAAIVNRTEDAAGTTVTVDDADRFLVGDLVVIVHPTLFASATPTAAAIVRYEACLVRITALTKDGDATTPDTITFGVTDIDFNAAGNPHCSNTLLPSGAVSPKRMMYRLVSRAYRIDPTTARRGLGVLQMTDKVLPTPGGPLAPDLWQDVGIGYTDLQVAIRMYEDTDVVDSDGDGDAKRDWYSGAVDPPLDAIPQEMSLSLVARTTRDINVVASQQTPNLIDETPSDPPYVTDHNPIGDSPAITLPAPAYEQHLGNHVYRYGTVRLDLRNMGVGR